MKIIVPTKGRLSHQLTISNLPDELKVQTVIVCPESEAFWHTQNYPLVTVIKQPNRITGIATKRQWILETTEDDKIVMLDDDLRFACRREDNPGLFRKAEKEDILAAFRELEAVLTSEIPHAGFAVRGGGIGEAAKAGDWQFTGKRMMYSLGYHVPTVLDNVILGRISTHEDMDITLQLLSRGYPNGVNFSFVTDQKFGNPGGCEKERTIEQNDKDVLELAKLHPGYVRVTEKVYKGSTNRLECVCAWQKCLADGIRLRQQRQQTT